MTCRTRNCRARDHAEDAAEAAQASVERARQLFGGRTPPFAAVDGQLLDNQLVDITTLYVLSQPGFASLASQAIVGDLSRKENADKLKKIEAEIDGVRKEHYARRIAAAMAEVEAQIKAFEEEERALANA